MNTADYTVTRHGEELGKVKACTSGRAEVTAKRLYGSDLKVTADQPAPVIKIDGGWEAEDEISEKHTSKVWLESLVTRCEICHHRILSWPEYRELEKKGMTAHEADAQDICWCE